MAKRKQQVSEDQVSKLLLGLGEMAKKPKFLTLQQTVDRMRPKLLLALEQGYTHQDVVALMQAHGIEISLVTLRQYLRMATNEEAETEVKTEVKTTQSEPATQASSTITAAAVKADVKTVATSVVATPVVNAAVSPSGVAPSIVQAALKVTALPTNPIPQSSLGKKVSVSETKPTRQRAMLPLSPPPRTQAPAPPSSS